MRITCGIEDPGKQGSEEPTRANVYVADETQISELEHQLDGRDVERHIMVEPDTGDPVIIWKRACFLGATAAKSCQHCPWPSES